MTDLALAEATKQAMSQNPSCAAMVIEMLGNAMSSIAMLLKDRWAAALSILLVSFTAACSASMSDKPKLEYRENPSPVQAYRISMRIDHAPGAFSRMRALAHYDVINSECLRPPKDNPGGHTSPVPTAPRDITWERVDDSTYTGVVFADQMLDEDYYGRGVCRWQLTGFVMHMKATGAERETLFAPSYSVKRLLAGEQETVYFNKISYPRLESSSLDESISFGQTDRARFGPSIRDEDLFTVTFTSSKEATP